jgi:hypothetical protein
MKGRQNLKSKYLDNMELRKDIYSMLQYMQKIPSMKNKNSFKSFQTTEKLLRDCKRNQRNMNFKGKGVKCISVSVTILLQKLWKPTIAT